MFERLLLALRLKNRPTKVAPQVLLHPPPVVGGMNHAGHVPAKPGPKHAPARALAPRSYAYESPPTPAPAPSPAYESWSSHSQWVAPTAVSAVAAVFASGKGGDFGGAGASGEWEAPGPPPPCPAPSPSYDIVDSYSSGPGSCSSDSSSGQNSD